MSTVQGGPGNIVTSGLILNLDAANPRSYPPAYNGTTWFNLASTSYNGTLTNGPTYSTGSGGSIVFDGVNDYVAVAGSITTTNATFMAWLRRNGTQTSYDGILLSRNPSATGMGFFSDGTTLSYHWNNAANTWGWNSGLSIPNLAWCMVAVSVTSSSAVAYLCQSNGITTSTNNVSHASTTMNALIVGLDSFSNRYFNGNIAVAQIYNRSLSSSEINQNFQATRARFGI